MVKKMEIVVIEGLDKSGKHTQALRLFNSLKQLGHNVVESSFHRYDTPTGKLIQDWLYKRYDVDSLTIELIMSADKQAQQKWFSQLEANGVQYLILDRYVASQICYSTSTGLDAEWVNVLQKNLRRPDLELFIDISPEESMKRKGQHGDNDRYESNRQLLQTVRESYRSYFSDSQDRFVITGCDSFTENELEGIIFREVTTRLRIPQHNRNSF